MPALELRGRSGEAERPGDGGATALERIRSWRPRRPRWRKAVRKVHLWAAFATGLVLLIVTLSGAILILDPEIHQLTHPGHYEATEAADPATPSEAIAAVNAEFPDFKASTAIRNRGVYVVPDEMFEREAYVDPGTAEINGTREPYGGVMGFIKNLHMCGLSCKDYAGYTHFLHERVNFLGNKISVGLLILGLAGVVLLFMAISGLFLWWPGIKRMARGFKIRRGKGGYSKHYDLHKVVGFVALPFFAMWAITGMGFSFKQIEDAWYALLPGDEPKLKEEYLAFESKPGSGEGITTDEAERLALASRPGSTPVSVTAPLRGDKKGYYDVWIQDGFDEYGYYSWPGTHEVAVDRWSGRTQTVFPGSEDREFSRVAWEDWNFTLHAGTPVGWLPRLAWIAFGLVPLLLAITGTSMWLLKRRMRRRKVTPPEEPA